MAAVEAGQIPKFRIAATEVWLVSCSRYARREGVVGLLGPVRLLWERGRFPGQSRPQWGSGQSPGYRMAAVGAWSVSWAPYVCSGGVAGPLGGLWPPWGCGRFPRPLLAAVGAWPVHWDLYGRRGAWLVSWVPCGCRWGVAGPLGPVILPCKLGQSPRPRMAAVRAWAIP